MNQRWRSYSSAEMVSNCEDLLTEILVRLPVCSLFEFRCVSKSWNHLFSKSQRMKSRLPLMGFFRVSESGKDWITPELSFLHISERRKSQKLDYMKGYAFTHVSPEGLMLCKYVLKGLRFPHYYVCDGNRWFALPLPPRKEFDVPPIVSFVCEECSEDGVEHFQVIRAFFPKEEPATAATTFVDSIPTQTFSSRTGKWSESFLTPPPSQLLLCRPRGEESSVGGIVYWKICGHLVAYDPGMRENNRVWLIKLPPLVCDEDEDFILGQSGDGCLRFALTDTDQSFRVWHLKQKLSSYDICQVVPSSEWRLKQELDFRRLCMNNYSAIATRRRAYIINSHISSTCSFTPPYSYNNRLLSTRRHLKAFHPRNPKLVYVQLGIALFCYDLESTRSQRINYIGETILQGDRLIPYFQPPCRPRLPSMKN